MIRIATRLMPALFLLVVSLVDAQQPPRMYRVGILRGDSVPNPSVETFQQAMRDLGYVEGRNIVIEYRYAAGKLTYYPNWRRS